MASWRHTCHGHRAPSERSCLRLREHWFKALWLGKWAKTWQHPVPLSPTPPGLIRPGPHSLCPVLSLPPDLPSYPWSLPTKRHGNSSLYGATGCPFGAEAQHQLAQLVDRIVPTINYTKMWTCLQIKWRHFGPGYNITEVQGQCDMSGGGLMEGECLNRCLICGKIRVSCIILSQTVKNLIYTYFISVYFSNYVSLAITFQSPDCI